MFQKESFGQNKKKLIIEIVDKIKDKKIQYDINREAEKIQALSLEEIDKS